MRGGLGLFSPSQDVVGSEMGSRAGDGDGADAGSNGTLDMCRYARMEVDDTALGEWLRSHGKRKRDGDDFRGPFRGEASLFARGWGDGSGQLQSRNDQSTSKPVESEYYYYYDIIVISTTS